MSDTSSMKHPSWLTSGDFTAADDPFALFAAWLDAGDRRGAPRSDGDDARHGRRRRPAQCAHGAAEGRRRAGLRVLHQQGQPKRAGVGRARRRPRWCSIGSRSTSRCACAARSSTSPTPRPTPISPRGPKQAQIGAWASQQSRPLESRLAFEKAIAVYAAKYALGTVPRPPYWSGYRIVPLAMEFWQDRPFRLHDRIDFRRTAPDAPWTKTRLYP